MIHGIEAESKATKILCEILEIDGSDPWKSKPLLFSLHLFLRFFKDKTSSLFSLLSSLSFS
jgi:hypothetical protein